MVDWYGEMIEAEFEEHQAPMCKGGVGPRIVRIPSEPCTREEAERNGREILRICAEIQRRVRNGTMGPPGTPIRPWGERAQ